MWHSISQGQEKHKNFDKDGCVNCSRRRRKRNARVVIDPSYNAPSLPFLCLVRVSQEAINNAQIRNISEERVLVI